MNKDNKVRDVINHSVELTKLGKNDEALELVDGAIAESFQNSETRSNLYVVAPRGGHRVIHGESVSSEPLPRTITARKT